MAVLFEYDPSRAREVSLRRRDGFTHGYLPLRQQMQMPLQSN
ncbi:hypothetical protein [Paraglaciecola sp.]